MPHTNPRTLTYQGKTQTISAWSRELGIPESTIRSRLDRLGLSAEEALSRPVVTKFRPIPAGRVSIRPVPPLTQDRGQAVARWLENGVKRSQSFGVWGSREAADAYRRWAAEWYATAGRAAEEGRAVSVAGLVLACLDWAEQTFRKRGKITSEVHGFRAALRVVVELYGDLEVGRFGPTQARTVQRAWVTDGLALKTCNDYLGRLKRCFSFGVSHDLVAAATADALAHVEPLAPGRTAAPVSEPVGPVSDEALQKILPHLHRDPVRRHVLEAIVRLQRCTGMRPGEVLELRPDDIDREQTPWLYRPPSGGKTFHLEVVREVFLGPEARSLLGPWIEQCQPGQPIFRLPARRPRDGRELVAVSSAFYRRCLAEACRHAGVPVVTPSQLRHAKATEIQRRYEDDKAVAAALGNTPEVARQVYVDGPARAAARRIAEELG